jgi:hypothetical protein
MKDSKRKWKHHSNVTSKGNNSEKGDQNLIYDNENAGLKITAESDLLVKNLESQESCDTNMCFGIWGSIYIRTGMTFALECHVLQKWFLH